MLFNSSLIVYLIVLPLLPRITMRILGTREIENNHSIKRHKSVFKQHGEIRYSCHFERGGMGKVHDSAQVIIIIRRLRLNLRDHGITNYYLPKTKVSLIEI